MHEYIRKLIGQGFKVYLLDCDRPEGGAVVPEVEKQDADTPKKIFRRGRKNKNENPPSLLTPEIVENMKKKKRINWKTIAKIKQMKEDGYTSGRVSDKLGIDLEVINKYWDKE